VREPGVINPQSRFDEFHLLYFHGYLRKSVIAPVCWLGAGPHHLGPTGSACARNLQCSPGLRPAAGPLGADYRAEPPPQVTARYHTLGPGRLFRGPVLADAPGNTGNARPADLRQNLSRSSACALVDGCSLSCRRRGRSPRKKSRKILFPDLSWGGCHCIGGSDVAPPGRSGLRGLLGGDSGGAPARGARDYRRGGKGPVLFNDASARDI